MIDVFVCVWFQPYELSEAEPTVLNQGGAMAPLSSSGVEHWRVVIALSGTTQPILPPLCHPPSGTKTKTKTNQMVGYYTFEDYKSDVQLRSTFFPDEKVVLIPAKLPPHPREVKKDGEASRMKETSVFDELQRVECSGLMSKTSLACDSLSCSNLTTKGRTSEGSAPVISEGGIAKETAYESMEVGLNSEEPVQSECHHTSVHKVLLMPSGNAENEAKTQSTIKPSFFSSSLSAMEMDVSVTNTQLPDVENEAKTQSAIKPSSSSSSSATMETDISVISTQLPDVKNETKTQPTIKPSSSSSLAAMETDTNAQLPDVENEAKTQPTIKPSSNFPMAATEMDDTSVTSTQLQADLDMSLLHSTPLQTHCTDPADEDTVSVSCSKDSSCSGDIKRVDQTAEKEEEVSETSCTPVRPKESGSLKHATGRPHAVSWYFSGNPVMLTLLH